jgi:hypothetical protein
MKNIELVIKISENDLKSIGNKIFTVGEMFETTQGRIYRAINKGTPLPKEYKRLVDIGQCDRKLFYQQCGGANSLITVKSAFDMLMSLPTIIDENKWIPVSKRLPEKSGNYYCTFGGTNLTGSDYYTTESDAKELFDNPEEFTGWQSHNVIAWMPFPEPYKPKSEDKL